jgi:hypothetical protein
VIREQLLGRRRDEPMPSGFNPRTPRTVFEAFRDVRQENMFLAQHKESTKENAKIKSLAELFRPPLRLMFHGTFGQAKVEASNKQRWLLVNIQDVKEFDSSRLNRDTWANSELADFISRSFILWQAYNDTEEGKRYVSYYPVSLFPHIALLDPRTGQLLESWEGFVPAPTLLHELQQFLDNNADFSRPPKSRSRHISMTAADLPEEEQMAAAIAASLQEPSSPPPTSSSPSPTIPLHSSTRKRKHGNGPQKDKQVQSDNTQPVSKSEAPTGPKRPRHDPSQSPLHEPTDQQQPVPVASALEKTQTSPNQEAIPSSNLSSQNQEQQKIQQANEHRPQPPPRQDSGTPNCILQVRLEDGSTVRGSFIETATLEEVRTWLAELRYHGEKHFGLTVPFGKRFEERDYNSSLKQLGLTPRSVLVVFVP